MALLSRCRQKHIHSISRHPLIKVADLSVICLQATYCWLYNCTFVEEFMLFQSRITAARFLGGTRNYHLCPVDGLLAYVSSITSRTLILIPINPSTGSNEDTMVWPSYSLRKDMEPRIMFVAERMINTLLPNLYFIFFAIDDTLYFRLMKRINLFPDIPPLG